MLNMTMVVGLLQVLGRTPYGADWYVLGHTPGSYAVANASSYADGLFTSTYMEAAYTPRLLDYGSSKPSADPIPSHESARKTYMCYSEA